MRISELSHRTGVSAASIKYYAREGLLPVGERTGYNTTEYGEAHVGRLRLIRALIEVGGLSITASRAVLEAISDDERPLHEVLGTAQQAIPAPATAPSEESRARVLEATGDRGWHVHPGNHAVDVVAAVLDTYDAIGRPDLADSLDAYLDAVELVAEADLVTVAQSGTRERMAETVVVGTVLGDTVLAGLRRLAQENVSHRTYTEAASAAPTRRRRTS